MFVIYSLNSLAGAQTILSRFANFFSKKGHQVSICFTTDEKVEFNLDSKIQLFPYSHTEKSLLLPKKLNLPYQQVKHIASSIRTAQADIIISYISATNILSTIASKMTNTPIILAERSSYHRSLKDNYWKFLRRITYPLATKVIVLTHEDQPKYHYAKEVLVIPNPLILKNKHQNIERKKIILGVGRLTTVKGFDMLIKAYSKLHTDEWKLLIVGEGEERENLQALIDKLNLTQNVSLVGLTTDIEHYYKQASIFVLSSRSEGFPGVLCEAMGYGCPSIAFNCPTGPKEIIQNNKNGLLIEANNIEELYRKMSNLINNTSKRNELSKESKNILTRLDMNRIGQKWENILENIIKDSNKIGKK